MTRFSRSLLRLTPVLALFAFACEPPMEASSPPPMSPTPSAAASSTPPPTASAAPAAGYTGHGAASVPGDVLAKYAPPALPREVSARIQAMIDVRAPSAGALSEDGKSLFFGWTVTGTRQVFRLDGPMRFPTQLTGGQDSTTVAAVLPDGKTLVVARDRAGEENPGLYLQAASGGALAVVQHKAGVQTMLDWVSDDGKALYYHANDQRKDAYAIYRYDIAAKKAERIFEEPGLWAMTDARPGEKRLLLEKSVGGNQAEYYEYDPAAKKLEPLFGVGEKEDYIARYGAKDGEVLVQTPHFGEFRRLYSWQKGKFTPVTPEAKHDVSSFSVDRSREKIYVQTNEGGYTRLSVLDARSYATIAIPKLPEADHVTLSSVTRSGRYATLLVESATEPGRGYVLDWSTKKLAAWHQPSAPEVDTTRFARASLESYPARDGTPIPMFVRRPAKCDEPCPVLVVFHGGPEGQARPGFNARLQLFVDAGYVVVEPNVRGSDGYGKAWLHADDGPKRLSVITDIEDAAKHIRSAWAKGGKAPKVAVFGGSYGGYSTLVAMTMFAGAYDVGVSVVGISNLMTFLENTAPYRRALRISEYGDPAQDKDALLKLSPTTYVDKIQGPLLIFQGATDPRVPAGEGIQMYEAIVRKNVPSGLVLFADEGHGVQKRENQVLLYGHALAFLDKHMNGAP